MTSAFQRGVFQSSSFQIDPVALAVTAQSAGSPSHTTVTLGQRATVAVSAQSTGAPSHTAVDLVSTLPPGVVDVAPQSTGSPSHTAVTLGQVSRVVVAAQASGSPSNGALTLGQRSTLSIPAQSAGSPANTALANKAVHVLLSQSRVFQGNAFQADAFQPYGSAHNAGSPDHSPVTVTATLQPVDLTLAAQATGSPSHDAVAARGVHALALAAQAAGSPSHGAVSVAAELQPTALTIAAQQTAAPSHGPLAFGAIHALDAHVKAFQVGAFDQGVFQLSSPGQSASSPTHTDILLSSSDAALSVDEAAATAGSPSHSAVVVKSDIALALANQATGSPTHSAVAVRPVSSLAVANQATGSPSHGAAVVRSVVTVALASQASGSPSHGAIFISVPETSLVILDGDASPPAHTELRVGLARPWHPDVPPAVVSAEAVDDFRQRAAIAVPSRYGQEWGISPARAQAIRERYRR